MSVTNSTILVLDMIGLAMVSYMLIQQSKFGKSNRKKRKCRQKRKRRKKYAQEDENFVPNSVRAMQTEQPRNSSEDDCEDMFGGNVPLNFSN